MLIDVLRFRTTDIATIGLLHVDGRFMGFALENPPHPFEKVYGETRIASGLYKLGLRTDSPMATEYARNHSWHKHGMIWLLETPSFEWSYFHIGNFPKNTDGCLLVANSHDYDRPDFIGASRLGYRRFYEKVAPVVAKDGAWCRVVDYA